MIEEIKRQESRESIAEKPYVVSGDLTLVLQKWADTKGFVLPSSTFFLSLRREFNAYMNTLFPSYEFIEEEDLKNGLTQLVNKQDLPIITLDSVYFRPAYAGTLDITRYVDPMLTIKGLGARPGSHSLLTQFRALRDSRIENACLVDDVIYSGDQTERIVETLLKCNIQVTTVCTGIAIQEGIDRLTDRGLDVNAVRIFDEVIDEVCERDFYPGVPFCGRTQDFAMNRGVPYVLPFGKPSEWASIPKDQEQEFSQFCMSQSKKLFEAISTTSGKQVRAVDISRKFGSLENRETIPITEILSEQISL